MSRMPSLDYTRASIHYETHGEGLPILLLAPGGMRSSIAFWQNSPGNP
jgi:hypothetical protein